MSVLQLPKKPTYYQLADMAVLEVSGEDCKSFLQGQLTCDLNALDVGGVTLGAQCNPQGKLLSTFYLLVEQNAYFIVTSHDVVDLQLAALQKYAVFSKVEISRAEHIHVYGIAGEGTEAWIQMHQNIQVPYYAVKLEQDRWLWVSVEPIPQAEQIPQGEQADWWGFEILSGYPHLSAPLVEQFIPQMLNLQALDAISFDKGCYTGQETVARAKYRGANNRALFILEGESSVAVKAGDTLEKLIGDNWRRVGVVLNVWQREQQVLISAVLPNDTSLKETLRLQADESSRLSTRPLPYPLEQAS